MSKAAYLTDLEMPYIDHLSLKNDIQKKTKKVSTCRKLEGKKTDLGSYVDRISSIGFPIVIFLFF